MYCSPSSPSSYQSQPHPLLKLMSLSATLPSVSSISYETMLLKSGQLGSMGMGSPIQSPSPGTLCPESPKSGANTSPKFPEEKKEKDENLNERSSLEKVEEKSEDVKDPEEDQDQDEVLSIGGTEDGQDQDPDDKMDISEEKLGESNCASSPESSHESGKSQPSPPTRERKYSSEDSFSIRSLCSPSSSTTNLSSPPPATPNNEAMTNGHNHNNNANNAALRNNLLFSIANILRPDFGTSPSPFVPQKRSLKEPPNFQDFFKPWLASPGNPIDLSRSQNLNLNHISNHQHLYKAKKLHLSQNGKSSNTNGSRDRSSRDSLSSTNSNTNSKVSGSSNSNSSSKLKESIKGQTTNPGVKGPPLPLPGKGGGGGEGTGGNGQTLWPAWVYCTRYSDRPSSGPRARRERKNNKEKEIDEKRPRTAFTAEQLARLKKEFDENRYLTEKRRQDLARELRLHENQIKIWFQNKRAKLKKASGTRGGLALQLMAQGLYNHSTISKSGEEDEDSD